MEGLEVLERLSRCTGKPVVNVENRLAFTRDYCGEIVAAWLATERIAYLGIDELLQGIAAQDPCLLPETMIAVLRMVENNLRSQLESRKRNIARGIDARVSETMKRQLAEVIQLAEQIATLAHMLIYLDTRLSPPT